MNEKLELCVSTSVTYHTILGSDFFWHFSVPALQPTEPNTELLLIITVPDRLTKFSLLNFCRPQFWSIFKKKSFLGVSEGAACSSIAGFFFFYFSNEQSTFLISHSLIFTGLNIIRTHVQVRANTFSHRVACSSIFLFSKKNFFPCELAHRCLCGAPDGSISEGLFHLH